MNPTQKRMNVRRFALVLAGVVCFSNAAAPVSSAAETDKKKQQMEAELSNLNQDKKKVSRELSTAASSLRSTMKEIETTQNELAIAKARAIGQYELMKKRIKYIYESSSGDFISMLLEAESMTDLLNKADFISSISEYDRTMLHKLQNIQAEIARKEKQLLKQQKNLSQQKKALSRKQDQLTSMIKDKAGDLAAYEKQLAEAKAAAEAAAKLQREQAEARKREEERKKAEQQAAQSQKPASGTQNNNSNNTAGSSSPDQKPVEKPAQKPDNKPSGPAAAEDVALFAAVLECEAGSVNHDGILAVATVITNRMESPRFPNTLKGVIFQSGQFYPASSGKLDKVLQRGPKPLCYSVARKALAGAKLNSVRNCYSFRAAWTGVSGIEVGGNVFF